MNVVERFEPGTGQQWLEAYVQSLMEIISPQVKGKVILDAGCGSGYGDNAWIEAGASHIDAYDISQETLDLARRRYPSKKITFLQKDFNTAVFKSSHYDIAVSMEVIEHVREYEFHIKQLYLALKPHGLLYLTSPNASLSESLNMYHTKEFTYEEMTSLLRKTGFDIVKTTGFNNSITSAIAGRLTPRFIIDLAKKLPFYGAVMRRFFRPSGSKAETAETMIFICKKRSE